jgi:hypothetical protein
LCRISNTAQSPSLWPGGVISNKLNMSRGCARHFIPSTRVIENHAILFAASTPLQMMCSLILSEREVFVNSQTSYHMSWAVLVASVPCGSTNYEICSPNNMRDRDEARGRCLLYLCWRLMSLA